MSGVADDEVAELDESDLRDGVPVIEAGDTGLFGAEPVVGADGDLAAAGGRDVDGVLLCGDVDDGAEVILHSGGVVDSGGSGEDSAVTCVDLAGGIEAACDGEAGEGRLRSEREADVGVVECGGGCGVPLGGEGSGLGGDGAVDPVVAELLDAGSAEGVDDEQRGCGVGDGAVGGGDGDGIGAGSGCAEGLDGEG